MYKKIIIQKEAMNRVDKRYNYAIVIKCVPRAVQYSSTLGLTTTFWGSCAHYFDNWKKSYDKSIKHESVITAMNHELFICTCTCKLYTYTFHFLHFQTHCYLLQLLNRKEKQINGWEICYSGFFKRGILLWLGGTVQDIQVLFCGEQFLYLVLYVFMHKACFHL